MAGRRALPPPGWALLTLMCLVAAACGGQTAETSPSRGPDVVVAPEPAPAELPTVTTEPAAAVDSVATPTTAAATTTTISPHARPEWLGTRVLPLRDDEFGEVQPTPLDLQDRQFLTLDLLPPPTSADYRATIAPIPADVLARSSWKEECPVTLEDLAYLTMTHWGFDGRPHTGEMIVHAAVAEDITWVFGQLFEAGFPLEQMRVIDEFEIDLPPTGDWNDTTSFVCRDAVGSGSWSQHAYGLAVDINPFHNPYVKDDLVLPELASYYVDRELGQPGMINDGDVVEEAFAEIGWAWGGNWTTLKDWMHFSQNGR